MDSEGSQICCIVYIHRKDYQLITARLASFDLKYKGNKKKEVVLYSPFKQTVNINTSLNTSVGSNANQKKIIEQKKGPLKKYQNYLLRITDEDGSIFVLANTTLTYYTINQRFFNQATFMRTESAFNNIIKIWGIFDQVKQIYKQTVDLETYQWGKSFQLQFLQTTRSFQKDEIMLIMKDYTSSNVINFTDKSGKIIEQMLKKRLVSHFKDAFAMLSNAYHQGNPHEASSQQNPQQNANTAMGVGVMTGTGTGMTPNANILGPNINPGRQSSSKQKQKDPSVSSKQTRGISKSIEFQQLLKPYIGRLCRFGEDKPYNQQNQYWIMKVIYIMQFVLKERDSVNEQQKQALKQIKKQAEDKQGKKH